MKNVRKLIKADTKTVMAAVLCHEYILFEDEFNNNTKMQEKLTNAEFLVQLGETVVWKITNAIKQNEANEYGVDVAVYDEEAEIDDGKIIAFMLGQDNRLDLNDLICETIEEMLKLQ